MSSNSSRIAKNTIALYFRQIMMLLIGLYTVRINFEVLGIDNLGIYNVVGGVVSLFIFINSAMAAATQRYLNFAMGRNDMEQARNVYSASLIIHTLIALIIVILAETVGLWYFYKWLNIPPDRYSAALVVYQLSIATTVLNIILVPYRAVIVAYERMTVFARIGILEAVLSLGIAFSLKVIPFDKLIVYGFLILTEGAIILLIHKIYCNKMFLIARFRYHWDKELYRQLAGFSGWTVLGSFSEVGSAQGRTLLINLFQGVAVNGAMGLATRVNNAVSAFVNNFQTAFRPQIIKSYAAENYDYFRNLIFQTSKVSFYLLFLLVLPLCINTEFVLQIWLNEVPEYLVTFVRLMLINSLEIAIVGPFTMSIHATGNIKKYQIIISIYNLLNLPLCFLFLWMGFHPASVLIIKIILNMIAIVWRLFFLRKRINLSIRAVVKKVLIPIISVSGISIIISALIKGLFINWIKLFVTCSVSTTSIFFLIYFIGINSEERDFVKTWVRSKISKISGNKK